ncbi:MAG TPA: hypothetical protein VKA31_05750 [Mariprofundaceae bacterium]|nr:hypothetical protein [Mariprofundaceae bacterium]
MGARTTRKLRGICLGLFACLILSACGDMQKVAINGILDDRDSAVSSGDIGAYSRLLLRDYQDHGQTKVTVVARMINLFSQFDSTQMKSFDRHVKLIDDHHAQCEQSYHLKVQKDGDWREITQREQLYLTRTAAGWRISGGL